jgi:hypothetical protein
MVRGGIWETQIGFATGAITATAGVADDAPSGSANLQLRCKSYGPAPASGVVAHLPNMVAIPVVRDYHKTQPLK